MVTSSTPNKQGETDPSSRSDLVVDSDSPRSGEPTSRAVMMPEERAKKAFDFAADVSKQFITLATGLIAVFTAFAKDIFPADHNHRWLLVGATILFVISILAGMASLMNLAGSLETDEAPTIYKPSIRYCALTQVFAFFIASCFLVAFGGLAARAG